MTRNPLLRSDMPWLVTVTTLAFVLFHVNEAVLFTQTYYVFSTQGHDWVGLLFAQWNGWLLTYGPACLLVWTAIVKPDNRALTTGLAGLTFLSAWEYQYPLMTGFLQAIGQFEGFSEFYFSRSFAAHETAMENLGIERTLSQ